MAFFAVQAEFAFRVACVWFNAMLYSVVWPCEQGPYASLALSDCNHTQSLLFGEGYFKLVFKS